MLGVDELVPCSEADVINVVDKERVGGRVFCQQDNLGSARGELMDYNSTNAGCAALDVNVNRVW